MARYHVCMVLVGKLPVPATLGGAVEALAQHLLEQNERDPQIEFTVLTVDEPKAQALAAGFRHAAFVWFKPHTLWNKVWWRVRTLALNCTGEQKELPFPYQRVEAAAWLKRHWQEFDYVLAESELEMIRQAQVPPEKVLYHLHWVGRPTPWRDAQFGQLLAVSRFVGEGWKEKSGCPAEKVSVWPNCAALDTFAQRLSESERAALRATLGIAPEDFAIVYCGRMVPLKGVKELLLAMQKLPRRAVLVAVGSTNFGLSTKESYERELYTLAQQGGSRVVFTGFVHNTELWRYYALADAVCMPTIGQEAAGLVAVEAMASGRPVVATRSGGIPEYVPAEAGLLVPITPNLPEDLANALRTLMDDPARCRAMGLAGERAALAYSPQQYYQNFVSILDGLTEREEERRKQSWKIHAQ